MDQPDTSTPPPDREDEELADTSEFAERPGMLCFHTGDDNAPGVSFRDRGYLVTPVTQAFARHLREERPIAAPEAA